MKKVDAFGFGILIVCILVALSVAGSMSSVELSIPDRFPSYFIPIVMFGTIGAVFLQVFRPIIIDWIDSRGRCDHDHVFVENLGVSYCPLDDTFHNYQKWECSKCEEVLIHHDYAESFSREEIMQMLGLVDLEENFWRDD